MFWLLLYTNWKTYACTILIPITMRETLTTTPRRAKAMVTKVATEKPADKLAYKFTVAGKYYAGAGKGKEINFYKPETFILPEVVEYVSGRGFRKEMVEGKEVKIPIPIKTRSNALRCALHIIQRYHLVPRLRERYEDFGGFR